MINDKTLEDKIYRVLLIHGQNSKEIAKMFREQIEVLKEKYEEKFNNELKNVVPFNNSKDTNLRYKEGLHDGISMTLGSICEDLEKLLK